MQNYRLLLLHVPKMYKNKSVFVHAATLGLVGLGNYLKSTLGIDVRVRHYEKLISNDNYSSLVDYVKRENINIVGFSLNWHPQSNCVIKLCEELSELSNRPLIVLGGFTASWFAKEILEKYDCIDYIVRGDGEIPIERLIRELQKSESDFSDVPNLVWRDHNHGTIRQNPISFVADGDFLDTLNDWDLSIYGQSSEYVGYMGFGPQNRKVFFLPVGRGCSCTCSYCAGSIENQIISYGRCKPVIRKPETVYNTIKKVLNQGFEYLYICFAPPEFTDSWYIELFDLIKRDKLDIGIYFECFGLPSKNFIDHFSQTVNLNKSEIIISPIFLSEDIRRKHISHEGTLDDYVNRIEYSSQKKIKVSVYFSMLNCNEDNDWNIFIKKVAFAKQISDNENVTSFIYPVQMEPGSPWYINPQKYDIEVNLKSFQDFYDYHENPLNLEELGYDFPSVKPKILFSNSSLIQFPSEESLVSRVFPPNHIVYWTDNGNFEISLTNFLHKNFQMTRAILCIKDQGKEKKIPEFFEQISKTLPNVVAVKKIDIQGSSETFDIEYEKPENLYTILLNDWNTHETTPVEKTIVIDNPEQLSERVFKRTVGQDNYLSISAFLFKNQVICKDICKWVFTKENGCLALQKQSFGLSNKDIFLCDSNGPKFNLEELEHVGLDVYLQVIKDDIYIKRGCMNCAEFSNCPKCLSVKDEELQNYCQIQKDRKTLLLAYSFISLFQRKLEPTLKCNPNIKEILFPLSMFNNINEKDFHVEVSGKYLKIIV